MGNQARSSVDRRLLVNEEHSKDLHLQVVVFRTNVPWWPSDKFTVVWPRYRPEVQQFWCNTDELWTYREPKVRKRRGSVMLLDLSHQTNHQALAYLVQVRGFYEKGEYEFMPREQYKLCLVAPWCSQFDTIEVEPP